MTSSNTIAVVTMMTLAVLSFGMIGSSAAQQQPTVSVESVDLEEGEPATVNVMLSEAPNGLSGYSMNVEVTDSSVAMITNVSIPDQYGISETDINDDGSIAEMSGVDLEENIQSGASDIVLAEVTVEAQSSGETDLSLSSVQADDDEGNQIDPDTSVGTISVGDGGSGETPEGEESEETPEEESEEPSEGEESEEPSEEETSDDDTEDTPQDSREDMPGFGIISALAGAGGAAYLFKYVRSDN